MERNGTGANDDISQSKRALSWEAGYNKFSRTRAVHTRFLGGHRPHTDRASGHWAAPHPPGRAHHAANRAVGPWAGWQAKQGGAESGAQVMATNDAPPNRGASPDTEPERQTKKDEAHEWRFDYGPPSATGQCPDRCSGGRRVRLSLASSSAKGLRGRGHTDTVTTHRASGVPTTEKSLAMLGCFCVDATCPNQDAVGMRASI